ncbi:MAG: hypothetical protein E7677_03225 [Ruminococcaceae bacterium]|nr:hypothetical protein [Oscillospiraceae bacterium]
MKTPSLKNLLPEKYYSRCEEIINHYRLLLKDCSVNDKEDFDIAHRESGITRAKIRSYLQALKDADIINEYNEMQVMEQYSTQITMMYEFWLDEVIF